MVYCQSCLHMRLEEGVLMLYQYDPLANFSPQFDGASLLGADKDDTLDKGRKMDDAAQDEGKDYNVYDRIKDGTNIKISEKWSVSHLRFRK